MDTCKFNKAWIGLCKAPCEGEFCDEHKEKKCVSCGAPATHECDETMGPFVCGCYLCADCGHTTFKEGFNSPLDPDDPENDLPMHVKKVNQKFTLWYSRPRN